MFDNLRDEYLYNRFLNFINETKDYPYFSSLYDMDDWKKDFDFFLNKIIEVDNYERDKEKKL